MPKGERPERASFASRSSGGGRTGNLLSSSVAASRPPDLAGTGAARVGLIGPVQPFRGGVAQYTTQLHRVLAGQVDLVTLSFRRQYPAWLFPGSSDRDPEYIGHLESGVAYCIDPYRPDSWLRAVDHLRGQGLDQVVITWWTAYWFLCLGVIARRLRRDGIRVTFLCHNVQDHEDHWFNQKAARFALRQADDYLVHGERQRAQLRELHGRVPIKVHPHPIYTQFPRPVGTMTRRAPLEMLFFGFVRPYKGVDVLIEAVALLSDQPLFLTIAGEVWGGGFDLEAAVRTAGLTDRVEVRPYYHGEQETAELFARADVVVLPYHSASASGVVALAYHYDRPVVVTRVGALPEVVEEGASGFVVPPSDPGALAETLRACVGFRPCGKALERLKRRMSWESLAATLVEAPVQS